MRFKASFHYFDTVNKSSSFGNSHLNWTDLASRTQNSKVKTTMEQMLKKK